MTTPRPSAAQLRLLRWVLANGNSVPNAAMEHGLMTERWTCIGRGWLECDEHRWWVTAEGAALAAAEEARA